MIRNLIFDFDGTLADSRGLALQLYHELRKQHDGYPPVTEEQVEALSGMSIADRLKAVNLPASKLPALMMQMTKRMSDAAERLQPFDGIPALLRTLDQKGYSLGIISSNRSATIRQFLLQHDIRVFKEIVTSRHLFGKSRKISAYMRNNRLLPEETVYIGDELRDIEACKQAGVKILAVGWGYDAKALLLDGKPDGLISNPDEMLPWLDKQNAR
ncbi:HAD-IA family hydrolase [Paenibacillus senegalensis]|uniref:HAD-IA family hydrolase n=1 Tax=Paenibacillus senegalensis TaxID=1465766 RepID=UPI00028993B2|nr:HAD-IA family hydrolase [Paenibacillus senegalensis]